jgi:hypothetical protein
MLDRLGEFVVPYQRALESEAAHHPMHLYLQGLLSQLPRKNGGTRTISAKRPDFIIM